MFLFKKSIKYFSINIELFISIARDVGMHIDDPQTPYKSLRSHNLQEVKSYFRSKKGLKLIIVIIPDRTDATYGEGIVF